MKILVIGDVHGTHHWKKQMNKFYDRDAIIFLGDYFDDWENNWSNYNQITNLQNILDVKRLYGDKVQVLLGNHDLAYLLPENISGHQSNKEIDIKEFLEKNLQDFNICWRIKDYIFSHAGFSKTWMQNNDFHNVIDVNKCFHNKVYSPFKFFGHDFYGNDRTQGPTWIRPEALLKEMAFKKQVVGHTETKEGVHKITQNNQELWVVDAFEHVAYLDLEI